MPKTNAANAAETNTTVTVASTQHEPANRPDSFKALKPIELIQAANAFATLDEGTPEEMIADLEANGVTWPMYVRQFKLPGYEELPEDGDTFSEPLDDFDDEEVDEVGVEKVITQAPIVKLDAGKYLVKFIGENWYFERGRYAFSKDKPYALMGARDAQAALVEEPTKFRQAFPAELEEYYS